MPFGFDLLCPDTADKSSPSESAKRGMPARGKKPQKIDTGISWLRARIWAPARQDHSFVILQEGNEYVIESFQKYQYKRGPMGFLLGVFDEDSEFSHVIDAVRYAIDPYVLASDSTFSAQQPKQPGFQAPQTADSRRWMRERINQHYWSEFGLDLSQEEKDNRENSTSSSNSTMSFFF
jgi:hypothetical protein